MSDYAAFDKRNEEMMNLQAVLLLASSVMNTVICAAFYYDWLDKGTEHSQALAWYLGTPLMVMAIIMFWSFWRSVRSQQNGTYATNLAPGFWVVSGKVIRYTLALENATGLIVWYPADERLFRAVEKGRRLYVDHNGTLRLSRDDEDDDQPPAN